MDSVKRRLNTKPKVGNKVYVADSADVIGEVELADDSSIWFNVVLRGDVEKISIGKCSNVQDGTVIHTTLDKFPTIIGDYVTIGHNAMLHGCTVENNVLIGIGAIVLDNSTIGENSIVAAGSLIPPGKVFPPNSLLKGSPAKVAKILSDEDVASIRDYADRYLKYKDLYIEEGYEKI
ncbi:MAG: gamma carbonic anhydrase family protein [Denitrovibrio sp.]|nr:MAG: gamma carbonic anhydrase family protein [Denitrovibrio sp.]